ncbi:MAG: PRC-barrel domain-containing protein [Anaerolineae bacterium]|nr:PRC-barrel domain-containing protein [Anaerolineae bacterium]
MLKGNDIVGKPVLDSNDHQPIKKVEELIFDPYHSQVLGFLLHKGGWAGGALALLWPNVLAVSPEAVITRSGDLIVEARWTVEIKRVLEVNERLMGRRMATTDGRDLGTVTDLFFDHQTGAIEGYEVAGGAFAGGAFAAPSTRSFAPAPPQLTIEADAALVPPVVAQRMEERADAARARRAGCGEALEAAKRPARAPGGAQPGPLRRRTGPDRDRRRHRTRARPAARGGAVEGGGLRQDGDARQPVGAIITCEVRRNVKKQKEVIS